MKIVATSPLDPSTVLPLDKAQILRIGAEQMVDWACENWEQGAFGMGGDTPQGALEHGFGEWASVGIEPDSSTLDLSVYRPMTSANGDLLLTESPIEDWIRCPIQEIPLKVTLRD